MNLNNRISEIIEYSKLSPSEFADEIEVQRSSISHITSGRNKPSLDFLIKVKEKFPELQWDWLITGSGEMLKSVEVPSIEEIVKPTSLPDLFALIDDDQFGYTESEDSTQKQTVRDFPIPIKEASKENPGDSQRLGTLETPKIYENAENQLDKIKRIVWFFESGKFESFEP